MSEADFTDIAAIFSNKLLLDIGAGDGKNTLKTALNNPDYLVVGIDAVKENLGKSSTRSLLGTKNKLENLLYLWSAVEQLNSLPVKATKLVVNMPWGSLQRGLLGKSATIMNNLTSISARGAEYRIVINLHPWEQSVNEIAGIPYPDDNWIKTFLVDYYANFKWTITDYEISELPSEELVKGSSWAKKVAASKKNFKQLTLIGKIN